jgi:hypothetical protein
VRDLSDAGPRDDAPARGGQTAGAPDDATWWARHRRPAIAGLVVLVLAITALVLVTRDDDGPGPAATGTPDGTAGADWMSGASGPGVVEGAFADWRGRPVDIAGTWSDNNEAMTELWQLQPGAEYADWRKPMDLAIGAIGDGETWAQAAEGAYDARWTATLEEARDVWQGRPGTLYIRFAHESNGNWYPWSVDASEKADFIEAWRHFRGLQQSIFPESKLVFCLNRESVDTGFDWRESFPGVEYVDVVSVDYYNHYPYVDSAEEWQESLTATDEYGAPKGLQGYLDFAGSVGLPLAVSEWSGVAEEGDSPVFIQSMHDFFAQHGGTGPGQLLYEILFDVDNDEYDGDFLLYGDTRMPESAAAYQRSWGG